MSRLNLSDADRRALRVAALDCGQYTAEGDEMTSAGEDALRLLLKTVPRDTFVPSWDLFVCSAARLGPAMRQFVLGRLTVKELECFEHSERGLLGLKID